MILTVGNVKGGVARRRWPSTSRSPAPSPAMTCCSSMGHRRRLHGSRAGALGAPGYTAVILQGAALRTQVRPLAPKYDDIVIDVGRRDTGSLRAALTVADTLLILVQPRTFDVWSVEQMAELVREARAVNERLRALAVLNAADSAGKDNDEAAVAVAETDGITCLDVRVVRRKALGDLFVARLTRKPAAAPARAVARSRQRGREVV